METVTVSADALYQVLQALSGPSYYITELQVTRSLGDSPIDKLLNEYNAAVDAHNARQGASNG